VENMHIRLYTLWLYKHKKAALCRLLSVLICSHDLGCSTCWTTRSDILYANTCQKQRDFKEGCWMLIRKVTSLY
jgi:hypothetical protein